jgi:type IV pilus assembly protein PilF
MIDGRQSREGGWRFGHASPAFALATTAVFACAAAPTAPDAAQQSLGEYGLARDAFEHGRLREALDHVKKALALDEENGDAAYLGALTWLALCAKTNTPAEAPATAPECLSHLEHAERYARLALATRPEIRDAANALGEILVHRGRYDEAVDVLRPLANDILYASPEKAWANLGWAYFLRGNIDEALDALRRSVAAQPLFCEGQYRLGLAYEKKGELTLSREVLSKALEPKQTGQAACRQRLQDAFDARARVAMKLGLKDDARTDLERCREVAATTPVGQRCAAQLRSLQ